MKRCPTCDRSYADEAMLFCLDDGTALVSEPSSTDDPQATLVLPDPTRAGSVPTEVLPRDTAPQAQTTKASPELDETTRLRGPSVQESLPERKPSSLPWILGAALILGLSGIVIAYIVTRQPARNEPQTAELATPTPVENGAPSSSTLNSALASPTTATTRTPVNSNVPGQTTNTAQGQVTPTPKPTLMPTPPPRATPTPEINEPPPPKPTPPPSRPGTINGGVLNGKAISLPKPAYPPIAKAARASGTVTVQVTINESGSVISATAISGHPLLQASAVQAARSARFSPTLLSGQPVKVTGVITYNFTLQ